MINLKSKFLILFQSGLSLYFCALQELRKYLDLRSKVKSQRITSRRILEEKFDIEPQRENYEAHVHSWLEKSPSPREFLIESTSPISFFDKKCLNK